MKRPSSDSASRCSAAGSYGAFTPQLRRLASPPLPHGPDRIRGVTSRDPLWDDGGVVELPEHLQLGEPAGAHREVLATTTIDARPRAIVTLPQHSLMPLFTALAIVVSLVGILAETYWLSLAGVAAMTGCIVVWLWPGGSDWGPDHPGHHELPPTRPVDPQSEGPGRGTTWYGTCIGVLVIATGFAAMLFSYFYLRLDEASWPPAGLPVPDPVLPAIAAALVAASGAVLWWGLRAAQRSAEGVTSGRIGLGVSAALGVAAAVLLSVSMRGLDMAPGDHAYASIVLVMGWGMVLLLGIGVAVLLSSAIRSRKEPFHTGTTAGSEDAATFWGGIAACTVAGVFVLTVAPYLI